MNIKSSPKLSQIAIKIMSAYTYWSDLTRFIPKMRRYSLGIKIDNSFSDLIELVSIAQFSTGDKRVDALGRAITKNDVLKFLIYSLHELGGIEMKQFLDLSEKLEEVGQMLYGWKNQAERQRIQTLK